MTLFPNIRNTHCWGLGGECISVAQEEVKALSTAAEGLRSNECCGMGGGCVDLGSPHSAAGTILLSSDGSMLCCEPTRTS